MRQMPNLRYTARARPHKLQRRLMRIRSRGAIFTLSGVRLLAASLAICRWNLTFCACVVMISVPSVGFRASRPPLGTGEKKTDVLETLMGPARRHTRKRGARNGRATLQLVIRRLRLIGGHFSFYRSERGKQGSSQHLTVGDYRANRDLVHRRIHSQRTRNDLLLVCSGRTAATSDVAFVRPQFLRGSQHAPEP